MAYQGDPRGDPSNLMAYDSNYKPVTGAAQQAANVAKTNADTNRTSMLEDNAVWGSGFSERKNKEQMEGMRGEASRDVATTQGEAQKSAAQTAAEAHKYAADAAAQAVRDAARIRSRYAKGGPVIKGEYKHAHPTYTKFGQTADSSLLAKGRK